MVSASMRVIKYLLCIFNFIFWVSGIAILTLGIIIQVNFSHFFVFLGSKFLTAPVILIVVGAIITIIAFFGCCGAMKENHCMMITFSVLLGIVFVLELAAGITAYVFRKDVDKYIKQNAEETMKKYNQTNQEVITKAWNSIQHDLDCCGITNYTDWEPYMKKPFLAPTSCCKTDTPNCNTNPANFRDKGCYKKLAADTETKIVIIGGVGVGIAFIQIIGIICACCLASAIKREYEVV